MGFYDGPLVDDDGGVLVVMRDATAGGVYRSADLGKSWQRMGKSVAGVADIQVWTRGGTYVVRPTDEAGYFPMDAWQLPGPAPRSRSDGKTHLHR
jgi:hypothetical protein